MRLPKGFREQARLVRKNFRGMPARGWQLKPVRGKKSEKEDRVYGRREKRSSIKNTGGRVGSGLGGNRRKVPPGINPMENSLKTVEKITAVPQKKKKKVTKSGLWGVTKVEKNLGNAGGSQ